VAPYQLRTYSSITELPREDWDAVWPPLAEGWGFYRSQEQAGIEGFQFYYVALYAGEEPALVAPLFAADFNMGLAMDDAARERLQKLQRWWPKLLVFRTLFCGAPTSEKGVVGIDERFRSDPSLFAAFDAALRGLARRERAWMIVFKDFIDADLGLLAPLKSHGWFTGDSVPTAKLDIAFGSTEQYLSTLSKCRRKDIKRKLKKNDKGARLEVEAVNDIAHCIDDAHRLYLAVRDHGPLQWERLTKAFFLNFTREMPANAVYFLYWLKDEGGGRRLVGLNFCLQFADRIVDKYIGMDYAVSRELNLYFVSFVNNVQWCIDHGLKTYILSQGGYRVKMHLGAQLVPLRTMTRIANPIVNWFANRFA
jgi:hypothetical protein